MTDFIYIIGYPRSGNTFLGHASKLIDEKKITYCQIHAPFLIKDLCDSSSVIVPVRNPLDSIASWSLFPIAEGAQSNKNAFNLKIENSVKLYIKFFYSLLENKNNIKIALFDKFTVDEEYLNLIFTEDKSKWTTAEDIKKSMLKKELEKNLPRPNLKEQSDYSKEIIFNHPKYKKCLYLYNNVIDKSI